MGKMFCVQNIFFFVAPILFVLFFIIIPFCIKIELSDKTINYFPVLYVFTTSILSIVAIMLGFYYYSDKVRRNQLTTIISELDKYDSIVTRILYIDVKNQAELNILRAEKSKVVDVIQMALDYSVKIPTEDVRCFIKLNSFVDKNEFISSNNLKTIKKYVEKHSKERASLVEAYGFLFITTKRAFLKNIK